MATCNHRRMLSLVVSVAGQWRALTCRWTSAASGPLTIPLTLMGHTLLATLANGYISALNDIRECAPMKISVPAAVETTRSLRAVAEALKEHHMRYSQSFDPVSCRGAGIGVMFSLACDVLVNTNTPDLWTFAVAARGIRLSPSLCLVCRHPRAVHQRRLCRDICSA